MSHRELWELSIEELDKEIAIVEKMIEATGYHKLYQDRLDALQSQRVERQVEAAIMKESKYAQEVLQLGDEPVSD
jgi:hypothetical protein